LALKDGGTVGAAGGVIVRQGGMLTLDNTGLFLPAGSNGTSPTGTSAITLAGGTLRLLARQGNEATSIGTVSVGAGANTLNQTLLNSSTLGTGASVLTLAGLIQQPFGTLNFTNTGGVLGAGVSGIAGVLGTNAGVNVQVLTAAPLTVTNGILGPWAVVNGTDWAGYRFVMDPLTGAQGIGSLGYNFNGSTPYGGYTTGLVK
jgi:fibronectin-binding autotransporter adhesin